VYYFLGEGIFTQDSEPWRHSREILRRQVRSQNLNIFDKHIHCLISGLLATDGVVDLQEFLFKFTLSTTTDLLFGELIGVLGDDVEDSFRDSFDYSSPVCAIRLRLADFYWLYTPKKFKESCAVVK
jgi:cytochrome P450